MAQQMVISGKLLDRENQPVSNARCFLHSNSGLYVRSDNTGRFYINYAAGTTDSLHIQHASFEDRVMFISKRTEKRAVNDTIYMTILMEDRILKTFDVFANTPDTLFGSQEYSVEDFEFDRHGNLVLLAYEKNLQSGSMLKLVGVDNEILDQFYIEEAAIELQTDFRNNIHLITEEKVYYVTIESQQFKIYLEDRDYYFRFVAPVIDTIDQHIYFSNYSEIYPAFDYFEFHRQDSVYKKMLEVEDVLMMELYRSEFKYVDVRTKLWAHQKQMETGIDKEIWVGATVFTNSPYYTPLYAPLFKIGSDSILVFDHYKNKLFTYRPAHGMIDSVDIFYHREAKKSGWEQPLIQDEKNGKVYAMFTRSGYTYLHEIDLETGAVRQSFKLYFKYVDRIKIVNGDVFYVYRPYESLQKKYIYREQLKGLASG